MSSKHIRKTFHCYNCNLPFSVKDILTVQGPRCPLILKCGHSICVCCAHRSVKESPEIICGICKYGTSCFSGTPRQDLPLNNYVVGVVVEKRATPVSEDSVIAFQPNKNKMAAKAEVREKCVECMKPADSMCYQCEEAYCGNCFSKVHYTVKALKKHKKYPLTHSDPKSVLPLQVCKDHPEQKLEFFCTECNKIICPHCIILYHQKHEICTVKKKNEEHLGQLQDTYTKAEKVLRHLERTKMKLEKVNSVPSVHNVLQLEQKIFQHFLYLHGVLQLMEDSLLIQVQELKLGVSHSLQNVVKQVEENIENARKLLQQSQVARNTENFSTIDVQSLVQKLEEASELPCHLMFDVGENAEQKAEFIVDEKFMEQLENHCKITLPPIECYKLVSTQDIPEDALNEILEETESLTGTSSQLSLDSSGNQEADGSASEVSLSSVSHQFPSNTVTHIRNDLGEGSQEIVSVCYIRNPECFFVHRERDKSTFRSMNHALVKHIINRGEELSEVAEGEIYAVKYSEDRRWYRARVLSAKPGKETIAVIQYIDFGNIETVPVSRLRSLPDDIKSVPMLCAECRLFGIAPVNGSWTKEANKTFTDMVEGSQVLMVIMAYKSNIYEVDLCEVSGLVNSKVPTSVRDSLVFLQYACFLDATLPALRTSLKSTHTYIEQEFKAGQVVQIRILHINSPSSFYVQKTGAHERSLYSLKDEMKKYYFDPSEYKIYKPDIGMPCAVMDHTMTWCRGQVVGLPGNKKVAVFFVDIGIVHEMPWYHVYKLADKFFAIPKQAIHCALNHVAPKLKSGWASEAKVFMMDITFKKTLKLFVDSVSNTNLFVTLYDVLHEMDICINAFLVREGYAISTGVSSVLVEYAKSGVSVQETIPHKKAERGVIVKGRFKRCLTNRDKEIIVCADNSNSIIKDSNDPFRLKVTVLALESPSCIFVKLNAMEGVLSELMKELQEYYSSCINIEHSWDVGKECCVYDTKEKLWCRGVIASMDGDVALVFLTDFASYLNVPVNYIQILDPQFSNVHNGAISCHLVGIKAAGDKAQWTSLACEHLADLIQNYTEVYITKRGEIENNSLPVELWVKDVFDEGPLEPTIEVWNTLNQKLVDQGLAIPIKLGSEDSIYPSCDVLKQLSAISKETYIYSLPKADSLRHNVKHLQGLDTKVNQATNIELQQDTDNEIQQDFDDEFHEDTDSEQHEDINLKAQQDSDQQNPNEPRITYFKSTSRIIQNNQKERLPSEDCHETQTCDENIKTSENMGEWLPAVPLTKSQFTAVGTNVDFDAIIYLQSTHDAETLEVIQNTLQSRFENSKPAPEDLYWFPGNLCIAKYHVDKKWYRGKVLKLNEDHTLSVFFVDYGNTEDCRATDLRKQLVLQDIPVQCHRCKLAGIEANSEDGVWNTLGLDLLHVSVVDKKCSITIKKFPKKPEEPYLITLIGPSQHNIADFMVSRSFARYKLDFIESDTEDDAYTDTSVGVIIVDETEEVIDSVVKEPEDIGTILTSPSTSEGLIVQAGNMMKSCEEISCESSGNHTHNVTESTVAASQENKDDDEDTNSSSTTIQIPKPGNRTFIPLVLPNCTKMIVDVIAMLSVTEYIITPLKWNLSQEIESRQSFIEIDEEMQISGHLQPVLVDPSIGMPCCAEYIDKRWYRAVIIGVEDKNIQIQYVDYGNIEYVPRNRIHEIKEEWLEVPIQALQCQLWDIESSETASKSELIEALSECILKPNLIAVIKKQTPTLVVELMETGKEVPVYKKLLDRGLLKRIVSDSTL